MWCCLILSPVISNWNSKVHCCWNRWCVMTFNNLLVWFHFLCPANRKRHLLTAEICPDERESFLSTNGPHTQLIPSTRLFHMPALVKNLSAILDLGVAIFGNSSGALAAKKSWKAAVWILTQESPEHLLFLKQTLWLGSAPEHVNSWVVTPNPSASSHVPHLLNFNPTENKHPWKKQILPDQSFCFTIHKINKTSKNSKPCEALVMWEAILICCLSRRCGDYTSIDQRR